MAKVEKTIEVGVPVSTAYNQWTQFEEFPRFMEGIQEVRQLDDARLTWVAEINGERKEWDARITQQVPDQVIAWESEGGMPNAGIVTFHRLGGNRTELSVQMDYEPEDFKEVIGDKLGFVSRRVEGDLKRFKEFIEERGSETGAWRGEIGGRTRDGDTQAMQTQDRTGYEDSTERGGTRPEARRETAGPDSGVPSGPGYGNADSGTGPQPTSAGEEQLSRGGRDQYGTEGQGGAPHRGSNPPDRTGS